MPINIRKDDISKKIAIDLLGVPDVGLTDSYGNKKRYSSKHISKKNILDRSNNEEEKINRFEEIGYR
jgi:hypothetical protein